MKKKTNSPIERTGCLGGRVSVGRAFQQGCHVSGHGSLLIHTLPC